MFSMPVSELTYTAYRFLLVAIGTIFCIHVFCGYSWSLSAVYGVSTVLSFHFGQGIVGLCQYRARIERDAARQENDVFNNR